jgi:tripartite-type tricarboxylate transporter receptor subunit TctC
MLRRLFLLLALCATSALAQNSFAQYPAKPIRLIIPWPAGGPTDILGRAFGEHLSKVLGQPMVIDNRVGASGAVGADFVAHATPDGYTLMVQSMTNQAMLPHTIKKLGFDVVSDFEPITQIAPSPMIIVAHPSLGVSTMGELVAAAREKPGMITLASFGQGSASHLAIELLMKLANVRVNHIPYKGGAPATTDTVAGHVQAAVVGLPVALPFVRQGRLRALGITTAARAPQLPDTPSVRETPGLEAYDIGLMYGFLAPPKTPAPIVQRLHAAALEVLKSPEFGAKLVDLGLGAPIGNSPAEMTAATRKEIEMLAVLAKAAGIQPE